MKKYKIYLNQYVTAQVRVQLEVESDKSIDELEEDINEQIEDWSRLARFHPEIQEFPGTYVTGSYTYDLDYQGDDGDEIDFYIEESDEEK
jgi:hypothetical protein